MFEKMRKQLEELGQTEIQIKAVGNYPDKRQTKVSDVAVYQNDGTVDQDSGTEKIKPSHFVERSARENREWISHLQRAVGRYLDGRETELTRVGRLIANDITRKCDRIKTTRLKYSFRNLMIRR